MSQPLQGLVEDRQESLDDGISGRWQINPPQRISCFTADGPMISPGGFQESGNRLSRPDTKSTEGARGRGCHEDVGPLEARHEGWHSQFRLPAKIAK